MQCAVSRVYCAVCSVQCEVYSVQCVVCSVQCAAFSVCCCKVEATLILSLIGRCRLNLFIAGKTTKNHPENTGTKRWQKRQFVFSFSLRIKSTNIFHSWTTYFILPQTGRITFVMENLFTQQPSWLSEC